MDIIVSGRQTGKTTELIKRCAAEDGYIVCLDYTEAQLIFDRAKEMGLVIPFPITATEFKREDYIMQGVKQFYVDNAELVLQMISLVPIKALTMTSEIKLDPLQS